jgi:hypothetical protein
MTTIDTTVSELFASCPELSGFSVGQLDGELCLTDVETLPYMKNEALFGQIAAALVELIDEQPDAAAQLSGRTFARTLH